MGWGNKAIEIRSVETGHLDGVFMHKKAQKLKFLCERNDKVFSPATFFFFCKCISVAEVLSVHVSVCRSTYSGLKLHHIGSSKIFKT